MVQRAFEAGSRGDVDALLADCRPEVELYLRGAVDEVVRYTGHDGIRQMFDDVAQSWDSFAMVGDNFRELGDGRVLVLGRVVAVGRASGVGVEMQRGWIAEVRGGKAAALHSYNSREEALAAAGVSD